MEKHEVKMLPWELQPWVLAYKVRSYRVSNQIPRNHFCQECGIAERTLRKIECGTPVRDLTVAKLYETFPGIFEVTNEAGV